MSHKHDEYIFRDLALVPIVEIAIQPAEGQMYRGAETLQNEWYLRRFHLPIDRGASRKHNR